MSGGVSGVGRSIKAWLSRSENKSAKQSAKDAKIQSLRETYLDSRAPAQLSDQNDHRMQDIKGQQDLLRHNLKELNQKRMELKKELKREVRNDTVIAKLREELKSLRVNAGKIATNITVQNSRAKKLTGLARIKEKIALKKTNSLIKKTTERTSDDFDTKQAKRQMSIAALREKIGIGSAKQLRVAARTLEHVTLSDNYKHKRLLDISKYRDGVASKLDKFNKDSSLIYQRELTDAMEFLPLNDKMKTKAYDALNASEVKAQRKSDIDSVIQSLSQNTDKEDVQKLANLIDISNRLGNLEEKKQLLEFLNKNFEKLKQGQDETLQLELDRLYQLPIPTDKEIGAQKKAQQLKDTLTEIL